MTSLLAIANADAGTADEEAIRDVVAAFSQIDVKLVTTSSPHDLADALEHTRQREGVVVLGGDGSLHAVVDALRSAGRLDDVTVGLVPLGTGNDFAATLGLPDDPVEAAEVITAGRTREIDLIIDGQDEVVVNAAHIGIGAHAAHMHAAEAGIADLKPRTAARAPSSSRAPAPPHPASPTSSARSRAPPAPSSASPPPASPPPRAPCAGRSPAGPAPSTCC